MRRAFDTLALYGICAVLGVAFYYSSAGASCRARCVRCSASLRQISLHVIPGTGHYGSALFGFHFYTLAFAGYGALVAYMGAMLMTSRPRDERARVEPAGALAQLACWIFMLLAAAFLAECGVGPCPDDPTGYLWWPKP